MRVHSTTKIQKIKELRKNGYSINEIVATLDVPRTTIWHHIRGVDVKKEFLTLLESKRGGSTKRKIRAIENSLLEARKILGQKKYSASVLSMLYWAEGNKESCVFTNTDPKMVKTFLKTAQECLNIDKDGFFITVRYFTGMNKKICLRYWSDQLGINPKYIKMYYNDGYTKGRSPYGMCRLTMKKGGYALKVLKSMISLISEEINKI